MSKPHWGKYGRSEIGILGAQCGVMEEWVERIVKGIGPGHRITYLDADHNENPRPNYSQLTDKISHHAFVSGSQWNEYDLRLQMTEEDLVLVNSNHFLSSQQIVFCTEKKRESLARKLDRLTDVKMIILEDGITEPFGFLTPYISKDTLIVNAHNFKSAIDFIKELLNPNYKIKGLILAGGRSVRMGRDKAEIEYHGKSQVAYLGDIFMALSLDYNVSCRADQKDRYGDRAITDAFNSLGPYGAILSAFRKEPDTVWLTCPCDVPLIKPEHFQLLIEKRNPSKAATCYYNPETDWPEPLITLWEPKAYGRLLQFLSLGYSCPRKMLINSDIEMVQVKDSSFMANANTPEEQEQVRALIQSSSIATAK